MIYPSNLEQKIGFDQIRQLISGECISTLGKSLVEKMCFSRSYAEIDRLLNEVEEFRHILMFVEHFPAQDYIDMNPVLDHIRIPGTWLDQEELSWFRASLNTLQECIRFFEPDGEENPYPFLTQRRGDVFVDEAILKEINRITDDRGNIRDKASEKLYEIRRQLERKKGETDKRIREVFRQAKSEGIIPEDSEITIRSGRPVIPVMAGFKRRLRGFIHDTSATGQTLYIEPEAVFEISNEIRELELAENYEIHRILLAFTDFIRPFYFDLKKAYHFLAWIDFIRAKARFSLKINAYKPILNNRPVIDWFQAYHPLLWLSHTAARKKVVPLSLKLSSEQPVLIISGPNAGGKSVCLKTTGLLQYMLQCGIPVPMKPTSEAGIFDKIFIDIGDEQSLENDLSTYSSHLLNMKKLVSEANISTLFLIDEFGTGTEPQLGGAIAEAILEHLVQKKSFGVVTTHYANLKLLADRTPGIANGAMLFDTTDMKPLYILKMGSPGSSFAFEIAQTIGLQKEIIEQALTKTGKAHLDFEKQLQQLEVQKYEIARKTEELRVADDFLHEVIEKYNTLSGEVEAQRAIILKKARQEAKEIISTANRTIENTIREIKEHKADKETTALVRGMVKEFDENLDKQDAEDSKKLLRRIAPRVKGSSRKAQGKTSLPESIQPEVLSGKLQIGDMVRLKEQGSIGEVMEIKGKKAIVTTDSIRLSLPLEQLERINPRTVQKKKKNNNAPSVYGNILKEINQRKLDFNPSLDLRGKRADEALELTRKLIDDAMLYGEHEVRILHGKGYGILRQIVREYLRTLDDVQSFHNEHIERGGDGITIVVLR